MAKANKKLALGKLISKVEKSINRGDWLHAARLIKDAALNEADFDEIMDGRLVLRAVFLAL